VSKLIDSIAAGLPHDLRHFCHRFQFNFLHELAIEEMTLADFDRVFAINVRGVLVATQGRWST
jgi:NAD(P)-dependent dehydrogenase (short-subunit alcohol dehydrogenase family)